MIYHKTAFTTVAWVPNGSFVDAVWHGHIPEAGFKEGHDKALELIAHNHATKWLTDTRDAGPITSQMQGWLVASVLPRGKELGLRHIAYVMPQRETTKVNIEALVTIVGQFGMVARVFLERADAEAWLREVI